MREVDKEAKASGGLTTLHPAACEGKMSALKRLLNAGADVTTVDDDDYHALHWACWEGRLKVARQLVTISPQCINTTTSEEDGHRTPLQLAIEVDHAHIIAFLLHEGAYATSNKVTAAIEADERIRGMLVEVNRQRQSVFLSVHSECMARSEQRFLSQL